MASTPYTHRQPPSGTRIFRGNPGEGPDSDLVAANTFEGDSVVNAAGDELGEIKELIVDVVSGRIAYAVLSKRGVPGSDDKLFAVPWNALTLDAHRNCFILDVSKERMDQAPGFDKDHWPAMADLDWATRIRSYYGRPNR